MFCPHCGRQIAEGYAFCTYCGGKLPLTKEQQESTFTNTATEFAPSQAYIQQRTTWEPVRDVGFVEAIKSFYINYVNFQGRATRKEFWFVVLYSWLVSLAITIIGSASSQPSAFSLLTDPYLYTYYTPSFSIADILSLLFSLANLIPGLALNWRRLHDVGKSGLFFLLVLIPIAGPIILLVQWCTGSDGDNEYGPRKTERNRGRT